MDLIKLRMIPNTPRNRQLYALEAASSVALREAAKELESTLDTLFDGPPRDFYRDVLPEAFATLLDSFGGHDCVIVRVNDIEREALRAAADVKSPQ